MKKEGKKAQITVFIIIGLILVLSVGVAIYFYQQRVEAPIKKVIAVPEDVQQVYDYVTTCLDQISKDGLVLLGAQGGYMEIPAIIDRNQNAYVPGGIKTPLWYYEGEDRAPTLEYMQRGLAQYIKQNMQDCTRDFSSFKEQFEIYPAAEMLPIVTFTDSEAIVELKWNIDVKVQDRIVKLDEFITQYSVRVKPMWELAIKTMEKENQEGWFENLTVDLMSANSEIPLSGMEFSCGTKKWHIQTVKKEIQNTLYYNLPYVRVQNTQYPPPLASPKEYAALKEDAQDIRDDLIAGKEPDWPENPPADVFEMNRMMFDLGIRRTDLKAAFTYQQDWPLLVNAQPNKGGILSTAQAKGARKYLRFFCINQWHFAYDLIYPIKMTIRDDGAFNGEGYLFQFGFPVIIEDNEESRVFFGIRRFVVPDVGTDFCENTAGDLIDIRATGFEEGSPVAIELENANITYKCMNQECLLGNTYSDGSGAIRLYTRIPEGCSNPLFTAKKEGYLDSQAYLTGDKADITMTKLKRMNYTLLVHPYYEEVNKQNPTLATGQRWLEEQSYTRFTKTMKATITLSLRNGTYDQYKIYPANLSTDETDLSDVETNEIDFVYGDAKYDLDILLFKGDTPAGGYHAENITINYDDLAGNNNVIFNIVEYRPMPDTGEKQAGMFMFLYERGKYTDGQPYAQALKPVFTP